MSIFSIVLTQNTFVHKYIYMINPSHLLTYSSSLREDPSDPHIKRGDRLKERCYVSDLTQISSATPFVKKAFSSLYSRSIFCIHFCNFLIIYKIKKCIFFQMSLKGKTIIYFN